MIQLHTIANPYLSISKDKLVSWADKGLLDLELQLNTNSYHQLTFTFDTKVSPLYTQLAESDTMGIRLEQDDGLSLVFVRQPQDEKQRNSTDGITQIKYYSYLYMLNERFYNPRKYASRFYTPSMSATGFISGLTNNFYFDFISSDVNISIDTGDDDNFSLLEEACKQANFTFTDTGTKTIGGVEKVCIEIGKPTDKVFKKIYANNLNSNTPVKTVNNSVLTNLLINNVETILSGREVKYIQVALDLGDGTSNGIFITESNEKFIEELNGYPLYKSPETVLTSNGRQEFKYWIVNSNYTGNINNFSSSILTLNSNSQSGGVQNSTPKAVLNKLYKYGVNFLKQKQSSSNSKVDYIMPKIILPSEKIKVDFVQDLGNGENYRIQGDYFLGDQISYTKNELSIFASSK